MAAAAVTIKQAAAALLLCHVQSPATVAVSRQAFYPPGFQETCLFVCWQWTHRLASIGCIWCTVHTAVQSAHQLGTLNLSPACHRACPASHGRERTCRYARILFAATTCMA
jgi:hypothetical protein